MTHKIQSGKLYILMFLQLYREGNWDPAWLKSLPRLKTKLASRLVFASSHPPALTWALKDATRRQLQDMFFSSTTSLTLPRRARGGAPAFLCPGSVVMFWEWQDPRVESQNTPVLITFDTNQSYMIEWVI